MSSDGLWVKTLVFHCGNSWVVISLFLSSFIVICDIRNLRMTNFIASLNWTTYGIDYNVMLLESHAYLTRNETYKTIHPILNKVGDFTPFYITIAICSVILGLLLILNVACCCSRYSDYWLDRHTGNRWVVSIWSATPHKQPPLDLTELESQYQNIQYMHPESTEHGEVPRDTQVQSSVSTQPLTASQEYLELHKTESHI